MEVKVPEQARTALQQYFGYDDFKPGQSAVIAHLLAGRSAAAVFPTGGGKSLCYQLPALLLDGLTLVVSPLMALMKDQIDALAERNIVASRLDSSLSLEEHRQVMTNLRNGQLRLLYVAPERFNNERFRSALAECRIALFAIDEAHCISEWGHNFRPDYLKLVEFAKVCKAERILALTATATSAVRDDICQAFDIQKQCAINTGFYRANLHLRASQVTEKSRDSLLLEQLKTCEPGATIVYVTLQKTAEQVAALLARAGLPARHYHAGMKDEQRARVQEWFIASDDAIVVATIAFGMGIDKSDIRYVYHYNLPKSLENYSQEIGRAGRDGLDAVCHLFACKQDVIPLQNFIYGDTPTLAAIQTFVEEIFSQPQEFDVSLAELSRRCDIRPLVLRTLLTHLEMTDYLAGGTPVYSGYQFKPLYSSAEILQRFDQNRQVFLAQIFRQARRARTGFQIDLDTAAQTLQQPRSRLINALDYLAEAQLLEVKVSGVRNRYSVLKRPDSLAAFAQQLNDNAQARERREIDRLQQVLNWVALDECQSSALTARFDSALAQPCGHCQWCIDRAPLALPAGSQRGIDNQLLASARQLQKEHPDVLLSEIELARVLCGVSSPAISRKKLTHSALFGAAQSIPYQQVLEQLVQGHT